MEWSSPLDAGSASHPAVSFKRFDFKRRPLLLLLPAARPCGFRLALPPRPGPDRALPRAFARARAAGGLLKSD